MLPEFPTARNEKVLDHEGTSALDKHILRSVVNAATLPSIGIKSSRTGFPVFNLFGAIDATVSLESLYTL